MAEKAYDYLSPLNASTPRYTTWFGAWNTYRKVTVESTIGRIAFYDTTSLYFVCACDAKEIKLKTAAYVGTYTFSVVRPLSGH